MRGGARAGDWLRRGVPVCAMRLPRGGNGSAPYGACRPYHASGRRTAHGGVQRRVPTPAKTIEVEGAGAQQQHEGLPSLAMVAVSAAEPDRSHTHSRPLELSEWS
jgi:hypothetical protein